MQDNNARTSLRARNPCSNSRTSRSATRPDRASSGRRPRRCFAQPERGRNRRPAGRSGCGKSSLLRIVSGLIFPSGGEVSYLGQPVRGPVDGVAMVFQSFALFPWLTVLANVELGLQGKTGRQGRSPPARVESDRPHRPRRFRVRLPEGTFRRHAPARRLCAGAGRPSQYSPDGRAFSALDVLTAETLRTDLLDLWVEGRMPIKSILMVTHNIEEAVLMCDRIVVLSSNPGRIAAEIQVRLQHPRDRLDPEFRQLVDKIYALMTKRPEPVAPGREGAFPGLGFGMALPRVSTNTLAGMIEEIAAEPYLGRADLPALADSCRWKSTNFSRWPKPCNCCASPRSRKATSN